MLMLVFMNNSLDNELPSYQHFANQLTPRTSYVPSKDQEVTVRVGGGDLTSFLIVNGNFRLHA